MSDIRIDQAIPRLDPFKPKPEIGGLPRQDGVSFSKIIKDVVGDAIDAENQAAMAIEDLASGNINDVHDVVMAVGKANMAIQLLVQIRNGLLEAYQELSRISS